MMEFCWLIKSLWDPLESYRNAQVPFQLEPHETYKLKWQEAWRNGHLPFIVPLAF